jgi:hypothetical protein
VPAAQQATGGGTGTAIATTAPLEDAKETVRDAYRFETAQRIRAVDLLRNTAAIQDPPHQDIVGDIILSLVTSALTMALGGLAGYVTRQLTVRAAYYAGRGVAREILWSNAQTAKVVNDYIKDNLKHGVTSLYARLFPPQQANQPLGTTITLAFFERQAQLIAEQGQETLTLFNNRAGAFERMSHDDAIRSLEMLRTTIRESALRETNASESETYRATLSQYANLRAELAAGLTSAQARSPLEQPGAQAAWVPHRGVPTPGVLFVTATSQPGGGPVRVTGGRIAGLNEQLRPLLTSRPIRDLGMNVNATIDNGLVTIFRNTGGTIDYGPRLPGHAGADQALTFVHGRGHPAHDVQLWAMYSLAGGSYGITSAGEHISAGAARRAEVDATWQHFREVGWTGARIVMEQEIFPQRLPTVTGW